MIRYTWLIVWGAFCCFLLFSQTSAAQEEALPEDILREEEGYPEPDIPADEASEALLPPKTYTPPPAPVVAPKVIEESAWTKALDGLDYSKDVPEELKEREPVGGGSSGLSGVDWTNATKDLGNLIQIIAIILALLGIGYGVYRMLKTPGNKKIAADGVEITIQNLDQYLHESDLDRFLREALSQKQYSLAIRLYFLQVIRQLSEKKSIYWTREKTNRDYLREMTAHPYGEMFRTLTRHYERIWYGNQHIDAAGFEDLETQFKAFLKRH